MINVWNAKKLVSFILLSVYTPSEQQAQQPVKAAAITTTSCPKARDGHLYPCPALVLCIGHCYVSRAAAPEGTGGDEVL